MNATARLVRTALGLVALPAPRLAGRAAYEMFRVPTGRSRVRPEEAEVDRAAELGYLVVAGKDVVTYRWGDGRRPVLLVHGWQSRASRFAVLVTALLEQGYSPVAFDAPGHGDSAGRGTTILEYREVMRLLGAEFGRFHAVVAHSFGVPAAVLALRTVLRADCLVALGGVCDLDYVVTAFAGQLGLGERVVRDLRLRIERDLFPGEADIWQRFSASYRPDQLTLPILAVHDQEDPVVPLSQARRLVDSRPDRARLITTRGLGHRRVLTEPEVVRAALAFLAEPRTVPAAR